jgi:hypothetical protein
METIFWLNQTFSTLFLPAHASFVKPKNRLHGPKSSSWWFFFLFLHADYTDTPQMHDFSKLPILSGNNIKKLYYYNL